MTKRCVVEWRYEYVLYSNALLSTTKPYASKKFCCICKNTLKALPINKLKQK